MGNTKVVVLSVWKSIFCPFIDWVLSTRFSEAALIKTTTFNCQDEKWAITGNPSEISKSTTALPRNLFIRHVCERPWSVYLWWWDDEFGCQSIRDFRFSLDVHLSFESSTIMFSILGNLVRSRALSENWRKQGPKWLFLMIISSITRNFSRASVWLHHYQVVLKAFMPFTRFDAKGWGVWRRKKNNEKKSLEINLHKIVRMENSFIDPGTVHES